MSMRRVYHEFDGDGQIALFDGAGAYDLESSGKGTWVRVEGGLGGQPSRGPMLAVWGEAGDRKGAGIRLGFRFGGAPVEEALPPPPPPPPPPPSASAAGDADLRRRFGDPGDGHVPAAAAAAAAAAGTGTRLRLVRTKQNEGRSRRNPGPFFYGRTRSMGAPIDCRFK